MDGDERLREDLAHGLRARAHDVLDVEPGFLSRKGAVGLVAKLHHAHVHVRVAQLFKTLLRKGIGRLGLFLDRHTLPGLGGELLARVGPEVGIMKIDQQLHAVCRGAPPDLDSGVDVVVAAAVAVAGAVIRIVPHAHADHVDPVRGQDRKQILFLAVEVIILHAAALLGQDARHVHPEDEILRQVLDLSDVQRIGAHVRSLPLRCGRLAVAGAKQQRRAKQQRDDSAFFVFHPFLSC